MRDFSDAEIEDLVERIVWRPQRGPQYLLVHCPVYEILFGGARGGGKSDGCLGRVAIRQKRYGRWYNAVHFRRQLPQSDDIIERAKEIFLPLGAVWGEQRRQFTFIDGGRLRFRPLENIADAEKYQGQNLTDAIVEEAGNYPNSDPIDRLHATLRSAHGVPVSMLLTANPGGPGHQWIRARYVDPCPTGRRVIASRFEFRGRIVERQRVFIPSRVTDNREITNLMDYIASLYLSGSAALVRAWLEGDWDAIIGAYFDCWDSSKHVIPGFPIPRHWTRFRSFDWGSAKPFSVGWWAVASETVETRDGRLIPAGAMVRYRERYGQREGANPDTGLKWTAEQVAQEIKRIEAGDPLPPNSQEPVHYSVADPSIFHRSGGPSLAERMADVGVYFGAGDNKRVGELGHGGGWDAMRQRLIGEEGHPMIYCFDTCRDSIRTIPTLQHDERRPEDLKTYSEDHAADEWRYACMSRPYTAPTPVPGDLPRSFVTYAELQEEGRRRRQYVH